MFDGKVMRRFPSLNQKFPQTKEQSVVFIYRRFSNLKADIFPKARAWSSELTPFNRNIEWETVWDNKFHAFTNPNHQFIHFKIIHRAYLTMRIRHVMGLSPHPYCHFYGTGCLGGHVDAYALGLSGCARFLGFCA